MPISITFPIAQNANFKTALIRTGGTGKPESWKKEKRREETQTQTLTLFLLLLLLSISPKPNSLIIRIPSAGKPPSTSPHSDPFQHEHRRASQHRTPRAPIRMYALPQTQPRKLNSFSFRSACSCFYYVFAVSDFSFCLFFDDQSWTEEADLVLSATLQQDRWVCGF